MKIQGLITILLITLIVNSLVLADTAEPCIEEPKPLPKSEFLFSSALPGPRPEDDKIIGGVNAKPHEFPFIVSIQVYKGFPTRPSQYCDGTIVADEWVLTAAHCCSLPPTKYSIVAGAHDQDDYSGSEQRVNVLRIHRNKKYNEKTIDFDICLLKVFPPFRLNEKHIRAVELEQFKPEGEAVAAGWGITSNEATTTPSILRKIRLPLISKRTCSKIYKEINPITPRMICAGFDEDKNVCHGDSGGPLMCTNQRGKEFQCGVVSWGVGCAYEAYPGVFTRVSYFSKWIECKIEGGFFCDYLSEHDH